MNISGPYIAKITPPLQIISVGSIDLKTVPAIHGKSLWRSRKVGEVSSRPPILGPATRVLTASLGMFARGKAKDESRETKRTHGTRSEAALLNR